MPTIDLAAINGMRFRCTNCKKPFDSSGNDAMFTNLYKPLARCPECYTDTAPTGELVENPIEGSGAGMVDAVMHEHIKVFITALNALKSYADKKGMVSIMLTDWPMTNEAKTLEEIKKASLALGCTKLRPEPEGSPVGTLKDWKGFSSHVEGGMYAQVDYYLEGNKSDGYKVRVHKATDGDHWYILS